MNRDTSREKELQNSDTIDTKRVRQLHVGVDPNKTSDPDNVSCVRVLKELSSEIILKPASASHLLQMEKYLPADWIESCTVCLTNQ